MKFEGVKPSIRVEPKSINFDKILLHRRSYRQIVLINETLIPLYVKLSDFRKLEHNFEFSMTHCFLSPGGNRTIEIYYSATEVQTLVNEPLLIEVS